MGPRSARRDFVRILLAGAAGLSLPVRAFGQGASPVTAAPLGNNLIHLTGAGGNVVVLAGPDGLVMVNGGREEHSADLLQALSAPTGGKPVRTLFNTDWHPEHTGLNAAAGKAGATIVAHENTKQYLGAELYVDWQDRTYKPLPPHALPTRTFYTSGTMADVGGGAGSIEYGHLGQAHTDAAIYVFFHEANVLVAGGAVSAGRYPIPDYTTGGWLGGLVAASKTLLELANAETRIIPGEGPIQSRTDLQAQHDMLAAMMDRFTTMMRQGLGPDDILAQAATKEYDAKWGNPDLFVTTSYRSLWLHVRELGRIV